MKGKENLSAHDIAWEESHGFNGRLIFFRLGTAMPVGDAIFIE
jgi:hypothetical protein